MSKESCFEIDMEPDKQIDAPSGVVDTSNGLNVGIVCKLYETCFVCKMYLSTYFR